jgi:hypothetical protein
MEITSPTVDRSQADGPTATRSQQQKAAAVQKAVAARKQRYLACAFPKLHVVAVNVTAQASGSPSFSLQVSISEAMTAQCSAPPSEPAKSAFFRFRIIDGWSFPRGSRRA